MEKGQSLLQTVIPYDSASFRDPEGKVLIQDNRVFRELTPSGENVWKQLKNAPFFAEFVQKGWIIKTWELSARERQSGTKTVLEHEKIPFISYAYEWPPSFLKAAALFHLHLCAELIPQGYILKDATPFNIQFKGYQPSFIDVLSIEPLAEGDVWASYGQFCDNFLYPLMLYYYKGIAYHHWFRGSPQGIPPEQFAPLFSMKDVLKPGVLFHVKLRSLFHKKFQDPETVQRSDIQRAKLSRRLILNNVRSLSRAIDKLRLRKTDASHWTEYPERNTYAEAELNKKKVFVEDFIKTNRPNLVWDLGCNVGIFSEISAKYASYVVSFDNDVDVIEQFADRCREQSLRNILPLVMDMANPSPELGWMCEERKSILHREKPDMILALALIHHLFVRDSIPLQKQLLFLAKLARYCVVEYVDTKDPMYKKLMTNITKKSDGYSWEEFNYWTRQYFKILSSQSLHETRTLYALESIV